MANLQLNNIPDVLHRRLLRQVKKEGRTISDFVLQAVERELARGEWRNRLAQRPETDLGTSAAALLAEERAACEKSA